MNVKPIVFALPGAEALAAKCAAALGASLGEAEFRQFPDGEWYVRVHSQVGGCHAIVVGSLDRPDEKFLAALLFAATLRDLGAARIGWVVPYLSYMRQDTRFKDGEGVTSRYFAKIVSHHFDWLVTIDPHLHRYESLSQVYSIPSAVLHAAPLLSAWIGASVPTPVLVGPDQESEQWVSEAAAKIGAPYVVLSKVRSGDRDVVLTLPDMARWRDRTPVIVDDVISTGYTMIGAIAQLRAAGFHEVVCAGVHPVFAGSAFADLQHAGAGRIATANTILHPSNQIDIVPLLAEGIARYYC